MSAEQQFEFLAGEPGPRRARIAAGYMAAYRKGAVAGRRGDPKLPPYQAANDWRRAFRSYWGEGWEDGRAGRREKYESGK